MGEIINSIQCDKRDLTLIVQSLDYIERRLAGLQKSADMLTKEGYPGHKEFLDTFGFQTFIDELKEIEESVVRLQENSNSHCKSAKK